MKLKERKLDKVYNEIKDMPEDEMKRKQEELEQKIGNLEKELAAKQEKHISVDDTKKEIEDLKKKLENFKGYSKNKVQIEKIIAFRDRLTDKLQAETVKKAYALNLLKESKKSFSTLMGKINNHEETEKLDNNEYNELMTNYVQAQKDVMKYEEMLKESEKKIVELKSKISKCNLAWRTLFVNKSWEEIQLRAVQENSKFTGKIEAVTLRREEKQTEPVAKGIENAKQENDKENNNIKQEEPKNLPEAAKKFSLRRMFSKIANWFKGNNKEENKEENKELENNKIKTEEKAQRDELLEGLRQYADAEYRKEVREQKEAEYIEKHKANQENQEQQSKKIQNKFAADVNELMNESEVANGKEPGDE